MTAICFDLVRRGPDEHAFALQIDILDGKLRHLHRKSRVYVVPKRKSATDEREPTRKNEQTTKKESENTNKGSRTKEGAKFTGDFRNEFDIGIIVLNNCCREPPRFCELQKFRPTLKPTALLMTFRS